MELPRRDSWRMVGDANTGSFWLLETAATAASTTALITSGSSASSTQQSKTSELVATSMRPVLVVDVRWEVDVPPLPRSRVLRGRSPSSPSSSSSGTQAGVVDRSARPVRPELTGPSSRRYSGTSTSTSPRCSADDPPLGLYRVGFTRLKELAEAWYMARWSCGSLNSVHTGLLPKTGSPAARPPLWDRPMLPSHDTRGATSADDSSSPCMLAIANCCRRMRCDKVGERGMLNPGAESCCRGGRPLPVSGAAHMVLDMPAWCGCTAACTASDPPNVVSECSHEGVVQTAEWRPSELPVRRWSVRRSGVVWRSADAFALRCDGGPTGVLRMDTEEGVVVLSSQ
mmetsp:Transcript_37494/g.83447  ORF Transcript_37494/g.83447 Transcript_37494/m.83447 type:complete len:342 (+) Transcript_37494:2967-3992(+)